MAWDDWLPPTRGQIRTMESKMNAQQQQIDDAVLKINAQAAVLSGVVAGLVAANTGIDGLETQVTSLKKQVADLQAANPTLDLSALIASVDGFDAAVASVKGATQAISDNIASPPADPAPDPTPVP